MKFVRDYLLPLAVGGVFSFIVLVDIYPSEWIPDTRFGAFLSWLGLAAGFSVLCLSLDCLIQGRDTPGNGFFRETASRHSRLLIPLLIAFPVIVFNLVHVFGPEYLLADDPSGYRTGISNMTRMFLWEMKYVLNAFTETFSWWMMAHYSPYVVRLLYLVFYLAGISLCVYWIARKVFGLGKETAWLAAVVPAILPLQFQIIAGVNMSYTLLGQLLVLLSLAAGFSYLSRKDHSWGLLLLSGLLFTAATRQMEQSVFVSASVGFIYLAVSKRWARKAGLILPVVISSAAVLHRMLTAPRGAAEIQNLDPGEIIHRCKIFLLYLSPWISPVHREYAILVMLFLVLAGIAGFVFYPSWRNRVVTLKHFAWLPETARIAILPGFVFLWSVPSILPFIALNRHMDARTMHLSGYGPWLLAAPGLLMVLTATLSFMKDEPRRKAVVSILAMVVVISGLQHMRYASDRYEQGNISWRGISRSISRYAFPAGSQISIVDADTGTHNSYPPCTGYLARMLGNRRDIGGIVGPEHFFYDPFAQVDLWKNPMTGLTGTGNLHLFRFIPEADQDSESGRSSLERFGYFLRVISDKSDRDAGQATGDWFLYRLDARGSGSLLYSGQGLEEYESRLEALKAEGINPEQICWGDPRDEPGCNSPLLDRGRRRR